MPPSRRLVKHVNSIADFYEPRMAVAIVKGYQKLQQSISLRELAEAIVFRQLPSFTLPVESALTDAAKVAESCVYRGMKLGEEQLALALKKRK